MKVGDPFNPHRRFNGVFVPLGLLRCRDISDGAKLLYGRLCLFAGKNGDCFAERSEIAKGMGLHVATIGRQIEELVASKFIRRVRRGRGLPALCQFLWHPALESCQRATSESAKVRHQEKVQTAQECASDSAKVRCAIKEEKIPLKDSLSPAPVREPTERREPLPFANRQQCAWPCGGWDTSEDFETWWMQLVEVHPNKSRNGIAKTKAIELLMAGTLNRAEFDEGYAALSAAKEEQWTEKRGRFAPNLWQLLDDQEWKFAPSPLPVASEYRTYDDFLREERSHE